MSKLFTVTVIILAIAAVYIPFCGYTCHKCLAEGWGIRYEGPETIICKECYERVFAGPNPIASDPHHLYRARLF